MQPRDPDPEVDPRYRCCLHVQVATHAAPGYRVWAALRVGDAVCVALVVIEPSLVSQPGR